ncbi:hypothetical protein H0H93_008970 [Arthromyces matolae]|nr:hypothetical protein H0H93_008970 [Arthromyces matolae]
MSIELYSRLEKFFSEARLNSRTLSFCTTVADIIREVSTRVKINDTRGCDSPATVISGTSTPRTLVPDDPPSDSNSDAEFDLKGVLAPVLGLSVHEIKDDVDFDSLGLDSLTSIEALHLLKSTFGLELSSDIFTTFCTPRTLQAYLTSHSFNGSKSTVGAEHSRPALSRNLDPFINVLRLDTNPILVQSTSSGRSPLFLIHDGSGLVNYYERLSPLQRSVWAIHNPNFLTGRSWESLSAMARTYAKYIADLTVGPVLLGGWSFGGVAAYEVARHLELLGRTTQGILLIDAPNPIGHVPLSEALIDSVLKLDDRSTASEMGKLVKAQFSMNARLLGDYEPQPFLRDCPPLVMLRSAEGYKPLHIPVPAWLSDRSRPETATEGWATLSRTRVEILDIPGHHFEPFHHSNVAVVSARISEGCDILEQL